MSLNFLGCAERKKRSSLSPAQMLKVCSKAEFAENEDWRYYGHYRVYIPPPHRTAFSPPQLVPTETLFTSFEQSTFTHEQPVSTRQLSSLATSQQYQYFTFRSKRLKFTDIRGQNYHQSVFISAYTSTSTCSFYSITNRNKNILKYKL